MNTLHQLRSGGLRGATHLKLRCDLTEFPAEIFSLEDTLEVLDLSGNRLSSLPGDFARLQHLKTVFFSDNLFTELPPVLGECKQLGMIGFKANRIERVSEESLPPTTRWLILTNNRISELPKSIGRCLPLQKVALAGNRLQSLPAEMAACRNLELLRISANVFSELPEWLLRLPKLSWLAFAGNPFSKTVDRKTEPLPEIVWDEFEILEQLGEGASGHIYRAVWRDQVVDRDVAIKVYKGEVTSDGFPDDELRAAIIAGEHPSLVKLVGTVKAHPQNKQGLIMRLIPSTYYNLGLPPSMQTCSRDTFPEGTVFGVSEIIKTGTAIASLALHLHQKGMMHGDLYAHNILIDRDANTLMGDFGAASFYDADADSALSLQRIEARAFGCLLDDLLQHLDPADHDLETTLILASLRTRLLSEHPETRPLFEETLALLTGIHGQPVI